jgi:hypothetical protein
MAPWPWTTRPIERTPEVLAAAESKLLEAQADAQRAEAEAKRAEAVATRKLGDAEAQAKRAETVRSITPLVLGMSLAAFLAVDFYRHESPNYIRRRMLATLRASHAPMTPVTSPPLANQPLPVSQNRLVLGFLPTMLLGPTGCGKSTLLSSLACEAAAVKAGAHTATPMVFVRMRLPSTQAPSPEGAVSDNSTSMADARQQIDSLAYQVFRQLGFPTRRAIVIGVPEALKMKSALTQAGWLTSAVQQAAACVMRCAAFLKYRKSSATSAGSARTSRPMMRRLCCCWTECRTSSRPLAWLAWAAGRFLTRWRNCWSCTALTAG